MFLSCRLEHEVLFQMLHRLHCDFAHAMHKRVLGHMQTAEAEISMRIRATLSGPFLSAKRIIDYYRMSKWREYAQMRLAHVQDDVTILRMVEDSFIRSNPFQNIYVRG